MMFRWLTATFLLVALGGCRPPGLEFVPTDKIDQVNDLSELMWVQADSADPRFDLAEDIEDSMTDAQAREFIDMGVRLQASGKRLVHFSMGPDFTGWSNELVTKAAALEKAARSGDAKESARLALSVRNTCRTCHDKYK